MGWEQLCDNPNAIVRYYSATPPLDRFEVVEADFMHYSPSLLLAGVLLSPPDLAPPLADGTRPDATGIAFSFWELTQFSISGLPQGKAGALALGRGDDNRITFDFRSETMALSGTARHMMIYSIAARGAETKRPRGPKLFSYHNVWNSCLLLARSKGFSLRLVGNPDERGGTSWCHWVATKDDGTRLTGNTPIELAGLIALYEHHQPKENRDYWWRIDGVSVLEELWDEWRAMYFGPHDPGKTTLANFAINEGTQARAAFAEWLARQHLRFDSRLTHIVYLPHGSPADEVRLLEVNTGLYPAPGSPIDPVETTPSAEEVPFRVLVADITPEEWGRIQSDHALLPHGWSLAEHQTIRRTAP